MKSCLLQSRKAMAAQNRASCCIYLDGTGDRRAIQPARADVDAEVVSLPIDISFR